MAKKRIPEVPRDGSEVDFIPENFMLIDGAEGSAKMRMDLFGKASSIEELDETKYEKPEDGIPKTDLAEGVRDSLGLADTALQASDIEGKQDLLHAGENIEITDDNVVNVINRTELLVDVPLAFRTVNDNIHLGLATGNSVIPTPTVSDVSSELITDENGNIKWNQNGNPSGWALVTADDFYYGQVTYAKICELDMDYDTRYHAFTTSFDVAVLNNGFDGDPVESGTVDMTFYSMSQANMARCEGRWSRYSSVLYRRRDAGRKNQLSIAGCFAILSSNRRHLEVWVKMTSRFNALSTLAVSCRINTGAEMSYSTGIVYETYKNPWKYINSQVYSKGTEPSVPSDGKSFVFDAYQQEYYDASQDEVTVDITDLSSATEFVVETPAWVPLGKLSLNADMQISVSDVSSFTPCTVTIKPVSCRYGTGDEAGYDPDVVISSGFTKDTNTGAQMGISCTMPIYDTTGLSYYWGLVTDRFKISLDYTAPSGDRTASTATLKIRFRSAYGNCEARTTHGDVRATWNT